jgi:phage shock protein C
MAKKLFRPHGNRMIGGVCAGLAEYMDIDVSLLRLIFIVLIFATAVFPMLLFYLIACIVIPSEDQVAKK